LWRFDEVGYDRVESGEKREGLREANKSRDAKGQKRNRKRRVDEKMMDCQKKVL
jgi:hypothetical protein